MAYLEDMKRVAQLYRGTPKQIAERPYLAARFVLRPLSILVTPLFLATRLTSNQITLLNLFLLAGALVVMALGSAAALSIGAILFLVSTVIDYVDGNVARFRGTHSVYGKFVDGSLDALSHLHFTAIAVGSVLAGLNQLPAQLEIGLGAALTFANLFLTYFELRYKYFTLEADIAVQDIAKPGAGAAAATTANGAGLFAAVKTLVKLIFGNLVFATPLVVVAAAIVGQPSWYILYGSAVAAIFIPLNLLYLLYVGRKRMGIGDRRSVRAE